MWAWRASLAAPSPTWRRMMRRGRRCAVYPDLDGPRLISAELASLATRSKRRGAGPRGSSPLLVSTASRPQAPPPGEWVLLLLQVLGTAAPAAVVGAMGCHVADAQLQEEACFCLVQLAWGGGALGKRAAIEAGAMPSLALVLATHTEPRHQKLQQMAKAILEELEKARHAQ